MKNKLPFELIHYKMDDYEVHVWVYPNINTAEIYLNREHFDTIDFDKKISYAKTWEEHPKLGRVQI